MNHQLSLSVLPDGSLLPEWIPVKANLSDSIIDMQNALSQAHDEDRDKWLFDLGFKEQNRELSAPINYFIGLSHLFVEKLSRLPDLELLRHSVKVTLSESERMTLMESLPMMTGAEYVNSDLMTQFWDRLLSTFSELIQRHDGSVASFFAALNPQIHLAGQVFFHLVESKHPKWPFAFMATYSTGMGADGKPMHRTLKKAMHEFEDEQYIKLLSKVQQVSEKSELVNGLIQSGDLFHPVRWDAGEAYQFLKEIPLYESSGVLCRIPDWWKQSASGARLSINLGDKKPSLAGLDALLDFRPGIVLGGVEISPEEARRILRESQGLAFIKNRWVPVDPDKLKQVIDAWEAVKEFEEEGISVRDAMRLQLNPEKFFNLDLSAVDEDISISNGAWLDAMQKKMIYPQKLEPIQPAKGFKASLRAYQQQGLDWLYFMDSLGFGACLADDMGLGKTVQVLAFLSTLKQRGNLLIIPASLMGNWISEIHRFFPELTFFPAHPAYTSYAVYPTSPPCPLSINGVGENTSKKVHSKEKKGSVDLTSGLTSEALEKFDLVITTYALSKKYDWLADYHWHTIILDEAQAIKNPATKQTQAVKRLQAYHRIILSGTPVENRISDLWSLFDFLNPGLLGNRAEFKRFSKELNEDPTAFRRLRRLVSPYILRRLKTDKSVISDLPDKVEMKVFSELTHKQVLLYKKALKDLKEMLENSEGIQRKGVVVSSLMKFKQLCNHPDQFSGTGEFKESDSGKFKRMREICETIFEKRERVLVFTQFKEMTEPIRHFLKSVFLRDGLVLHGGVPVGKRKALIEQFQDDAYCPFMVLSLKAGGVGLNLTRANHVIHFDRWWNPAVENQATDRAFRIGQKKNVLVHKFITKGTIEEKIDKMIEEKQALSDKLISASSENLITEMDNKEIMNLFQLTL